MTPAAAAVIFRATTINTISLSPLLSFCSLVTLVLLFYHCPTPPRRSSPQKNSCPRRVIAARGSPNLAGLRTHQPWSGKSARGPLPSLSLSLPITPKFDGTWGMYPYRIPTTEQQRPASITVSLGSMLRLPNEHCSLLRLIGGDCARQSTSSSYAWLDAFVSRDF